MRDLRGSVDLRERRQGKVDPNLTGVEGNLGGSRLTCHRQGSLSTSSCRDGVGSVREVSFQGGDARLRSQKNAVFALVVAS